MGKRYRDQQGRVLYVRRGIGTPEVYFTAVAPKGKRYKSQRVPARLSQHLAQADLDAMAARKGWEEVADG